MASCSQSPQFNKIHVVCQRDNLLEYTILFTHKKYRFVDIALFEFILLY